MKRKIHLCILLSLPIFLSSCSASKSDSISEVDADAVRLFCANYSNFYETKYPAVLDLESNYQSNVAILNEKYPDNLELKQLNLSVQTAISYIGWVRGLDALVDGATMSIFEDVESLYGNAPPASATSVTSGLSNSCEPFNR
jgi:hypothetical protein